MNIFPFFNLSHSRATLLTVGLLAVSFIQGVHGEEVIPFQPVLYVFKPSAFNSVTVTGSPTRSEGNALLIGAGSEIHFDNSTLALRGAEFSWNNGGLAPKQINLINLPTLQIRYNKTAVVRCVAPTQYLEALPGGTFALREVSATSPDVPRYVLSFTVTPVTPLKNELTVTFSLERASIDHREKLGGVELDVGKPKIKVQQESAHFVVQRGEWTAILIKDPDDDSSTLTLIKALQEGSRIDGPDVAVTSTPGPAIGVRVLAQQSDFGKQAEQLKATPLYYTLYDGGLMEVGKSVAGEDPPRPAQVRQQLESVLRDRGYLPATSEHSPQVALIYHWGYIYNSYPGGSVALQDMNASDTFFTFFIVSAYDYNELKNAKKTLLWRTDVDTGDASPLTNALATLISAGAPFFGRNLETRQVGSVPNSGFRSALADEANGQAALPPDPGVERSVHALIELQRRALIAKSYLKFSKEDQLPHQPIPLK